MAHPARQPGRFFLSLKQDQIREHPISEHALGACLHVRPLDAFALLGGPSWCLFLQRANRREEPLSLTRRKGFDVIKKFGSVHEQYEYLIRHDYQTMTTTTGLHVRFDEGKVGRDRAQVPLREYRPGGQPQLKKVACHLLGPCDRHPLGADRRGLRAYCIEPCDSEPIAES